MENSEVRLPSGASLKITLSPFAVSRELYQVFLQEARGINVDLEKEMDANFFKEILIVGMSSKRFEKALDECMKKCTYDDRKIDQDTFEKSDARGDYLIACFEVAKANILPFTKSLSVLLSTLVGEITTLGQKLN